MNRNSCFMKNLKIFFIGVILIFVKGSSLFAQEKKLGLGISLFYPTGITFKYRWDQKISIESTIGIAEQGGHFHAGILYDFYNINKDFKLYTGGAFFMEERKKKTKLFKGIFEESKSFYPGVRAPFGFVYYGNNSFDIFAEISMNLLIKEGLDGFLGIAIGIRGYF